MTKESGYENFRGHPHPLEGTDQRTEGQRTKFGVGCKWRRVRKHDESRLSMVQTGGALGI